MIDSVRWDAQSQSLMFGKTVSALSLNDVSYIKLVGRGRLDVMEIVGDFRVLDK